MEEDKSIFLSPYDIVEFNQQFVRKYVKKLQQQCELQDSFIHQMDESGNKFGCWRVHIPTKNPAGYYIDEDGKRHEQFFITVWISYSGILSVYPSDRRNENKNRAIQFRPKNSSKVKYWLSFHWIQLYVQIVTLSILLK